MDPRPVIVGIGGTLRSPSSSENALRLALSAAEQCGAEVVLFSGRALELPLYNPSDPNRTPAAMRLIEALRRADGVVISSPSYHGGISGLVKNALDYVEDLRDDERPYLDEVPVGVISCGGGWQGASSALANLRAIVHALRGWPTPFGAVINTSAPLFDAKGKCLDEAVAQQLRTVGRQVARRVLASAARSPEGFIA